MASETPAGQAQAGSDGPGSASVTVGDMTWQFDNALCAFGEEQIGQSGAEFVLSSTQDGIQFYLSIDDFGHRATVDDVADFENPTVSLSSADGAEPFITVDGKDISGRADFIDFTTDSTEGIPGSFEGVCP